MHHQLTCTLAIRSSASYSWRWIEAKPGSHVGVLHAAGVILERTTTGGLVKKTHFTIHDVIDVVDLRAVVNTGRTID